MLSPNSDCLTTHSVEYSQTALYGNSLDTDTSSLRTVCFLPGERKPLHFLLSQPALYKMDTPLIRRLSLVPSVSVLTRFDCTLTRLLLGPQVNYLLGTDHQKCYGAGGGGGWGIFESQELFYRYQIPCINFFQAVSWISFGLIGVHDFFFHLIFLCANITFFILRLHPPPPPPIGFLMVRPLLI